MELRGQFHIAAALLRFAPCRQKTWWSPRTS